MSKFNYLMIFVLMILFTAMGCSEREDFDEYYTQGRKFFQKEDYRNAIPCLKKAVELDNTSVMTHVLLGDCLVKTAQFDQGKKHYLRALQVSKASFSLSASGLVTLYDLQGDLDSAIDLMLLSLEVKPSPLKYSYLGMLYFRAEQYQHSIDAYNKTDDIAHLFPDTYFYRGMSYVKLEKRAEALSEYEKLKELNEQLAGLLYAEIEKMQ